MNSSVGAVAIEQETVANQHEHMLRAAMEGMDQGILVYDQDLKVIAFNEKLKSLFDFDQAQLVIGVPFEYLVKMMISRGARVDEFTDTEQVEKRLKIARTFEPFFSDSLLPNGRKLSIRGNPIPGGGYVTTYTDVTRQRASEELVRENENRLKRMLEGSPVGITVLDLETRHVVYRNSSYNRILGLNPDQDFEGAYNPETFINKAAAEALNRIVMDHNYFHEEVVERVHVDGSSVRAHHIWRPIVWEGHDAAICWVYDLSEQQKLETQLRLNNTELDGLNRQKDRFFSILAHDLRSPFNAMMGYADLLNSRVEKLDIRQIKDYSDHISEAGEGLLTLLNNLLHWSQSQMKQLQINPVHCRVNELIAEVEKTLGPVARRKGIEVKPDKLDFDILADRDMIITVLRNLISNAIKFTPSGGMIRISGYINGGMANISVEDTGRGLDDDQVRDLFSLDQTTSTPGTSGETGTGLGLVLCNEFARENGGALYVASEVNHGTTFTLSLPLASKAE
jgi:PAS domain S-box-containing protein